MKRQNENLTDQQLEMEDRTEKEQGSRASGSKAGRLLRILLILLGICAVCAVGYGYYWNLPAKRAERILQEADALLEQALYEEAEGRYEEVLRIDRENLSAREGLLLALTGQADGLASGQESGSEVRACELYGEILDQCGDLLEKGVETETIRTLQEETAGKLEALRARMAAASEAVETSLVRDDRSGTAVRADGTEQEYTLYYDLVHVEDGAYPYAETINKALLLDRDLFFDQAGDSLAEAAAKSSGEGEFRNYVGVSGIYSGDGLLCVRMAEVRIRGSSRAVYYRGKTFRLSDAEEVTLGDLSGKTDSGLRRLAKRSIRDWFSQEGYRNIPRSAIENYVQETDVGDLKFCLRDDGALCLVIDQEVPFFTGGTEVLEIPLEE